jgi:hypothetical protein
LSNTAFESGKVAYPFCFLYYWYMRRGFARIKGVGFILWHGKHMLLHICFGLVWAWILREVWQEFNTRWIFTAVLGSLLPDVDHVVYFFTYGRRDLYTRTIVDFIKTRQWRVLVSFIEKGHKYNTNLSFHNVYVAVALFAVCIASYLYDWKTSLVLVGAMVTHFAFDISEDLVVLGYVNSNWKRIGYRKKNKIHGPPIQNIIK